MQRELEKAFFGRAMRFEWRFSMWIEAETRFSLENPNNHLQCRLNILICIWSYILILLNLKYKMITIVLRTGRSPSQMKHVGEAGARINGKGKEILVNLLYQTLVARLALICRINYFFKKNVVWQMLIFANIFQYSFIFSVKFFLKKINFLKFRHSFFGII